MLCPHCGKDVDGYVLMPPAQQCNAAAVGAPAPATFTVNVVGAAEPSLLQASPGSVLFLPQVNNGCAGGQPLNLHYCLF